MNGKITEWLNALYRKIQESPLPAGTHWVRCFYGQMNNRTLVVEVLLDNEIWNPVQSEMARLEMPQQEEYYSSRVFLVIQDVKK